MFLVEVSLLEAVTLTLVIVPCCVLHGQQMSNVGYRLMHLSSTHALDELLCLF